MADITLSDISNAMGFNQKEPAKDFSYYGTIISEDVENNTYQVSINRDPSTTVTAARMIGAQVGDVVIVTVLANGHATVTSCKGGDRDALKAAAEADKAAKMADAVVSEVEAANARIDNVEGGYTVLNQKVDRYKLDTDTAIGNIITRTTDIQTDLDGAKQTVSEHSTVIQSINENISAMGQEIWDGEGNSLIQAHYSEFKQTSSEISTEVRSKVGNDEVISKINQSGESIKIQANKVEITGDFIVNAIGGIGGKNLLRKTPQFEDPTAYGCYRLDLTENLISGQKYTFQIWGATLDSGSSGMGLYWGGGYIRLDPKGESWRPVNGYHTCTFTAPYPSQTSKPSDMNNPFLYLFNFVNGHSGSNFKMSHWKLEKGAIPTDYSLADEDMEVQDHYNLIAGTLNPKIKTHTQPYFIVSSMGVGVGSIVKLSDADTPVKTTNWAFRITGNGAGTNRDFGQEISDFSTLWTSGEWTFSAYVRAVGASTVTAQVRIYGEYQNCVKTQSVGTSWTKIEFPLTISGTKGNASHKILFGLTGAGGIDYVDPRLTRGYASNAALNSVRTTATSAYNNANSANNKLAVKDTRHDNQNPLWYMTNYPRQSVIEFKYCGNIGVPAKEAYCYLRTDVPWPDASGGYPKQTAEVGNTQYVRVGTSNTTWGAWEDWSDYMIFRSSGDLPGLTIGSNRVSATNAKVNIRSDGIRMWGNDNIQRIFINSSYGVVVGQLTKGHTQVTDNGLSVYDVNNKLAATFASNGVTLFNNNETVSEFKKGLIRLYTESPHTFLTQLRLDKYGLRIGYTRSDGSIGGIRAGFVFNSDDTMNVQAYNFIVGNNVKVDAQKGVVSTSMGDRYMLRAFPIYNKDQTEIINYGTQLGNDDKETRIFGSKIWASKTITGSDERVKKDFKQLDNAKDFINSLKTFSYKWDADSDLWEPEAIPDEYIHFGVSAQNVIEEMKKYDMDPEVYSLVDTSGSYYGVAYSDFIPLLIRTVQDQQKEIDELRQIINTVKMEVI